jgi:hypothetical protein
MHNPTRSFQKCTKSHEELPNMHEAFPAVHEEFSFRKTICTLSRNMSDMMDEGDISDIPLMQLAEMRECEAKPPDISHMDLLYAEIDDITLSEVG